MVSKPEHSTSLTVRGPSSVVSRPGLSRTKRYNRSHTGGTSYIPQNEFPVFSHSGDVEIVVKAGGHECRYLLHRHTLTRCSGFFEASTSQEWSRPLPESSSTELARIGEDSSGEGRGAGGEPPTRKRWRYELDPGTGEGDIPMLVQRDEQKQDGGHSTAVSLFGGPGNGAVVKSKANSQDDGQANRTFFRSVANLSLAPSTPQPPPLSQADQDLLRDYDNLFRVFYNYPPILDGINIADAYVQCKSLLTLADQYDALAVVGPRVDHHLLQFQSRLWKQIAKYPISYLRLGYLARSKIIFQEALIHVVGQWPNGERSLRAALPNSVMEIIEDKVDELEETVGRVEGRLFRLNLKNARGEPVTPANSYLDWLAVSLFRQWIADHTGPAAAAVRGIGSRDGPEVAPPLGHTYRLLGGANLAAYLNHDECKKFLKLTPELYNRDNLRKFERRLDELKALARELVRPLMGSGLELDMAGAGRMTDGIMYLTCTTVGDRDLPWPVDE